MLQAERPHADRRLRDVLSELGTACSRYLTLTQSRTAATSGRTRLDIERLKMCQREIVRVYRLPSVSALRHCKGDETYFGRAAASGHCLLIIKPSVSVAVSVVCLSSVIFRLLSVCPASDLRNYTIYARNFITPTRNQARRARI